LHEEVKEEIKEEEEFKMSEIEEEHKSGSSHPTTEEVEAISLQNHDETISMGSIVLSSVQGSIPES